MSICNLPYELRQRIAEPLDSEDAINALARTNRAFYTQSNHFLYQYHLNDMPRDISTGVDLGCRTWGVQHPSQASQRRRKPLPPSDLAGSEFDE